MHTEAEIQAAYPRATEHKRKRRWRVRTKGKHRQDIWLTGLPFTPDFDATYRAAIEGRPLKAAPTENSPLTSKTFGAAVNLVEQSDWYRLESSPLTTGQFDDRIGRFMKTRLDPKSTATWRDAPVEYMTTERLEAFLKPIVAKTPTYADQMLTYLKRVIKEALAKKWITYDPTYGVKVKIPWTGGHKAWPREYREKFEARWPIGTKQRAAYAIGFWMGNRVSDIARLRQDSLDKHEIQNLDGEIEEVLAFAFRQKKNSFRTGGKEMFLKATKPLLDAIEPFLGDGNEYVLTTRFGGRYKEHSLSSQMRTWCADAGIPARYTFHGLRKALGCYLAENGATAVQIQHILGHSTLKEAETYIREANKKLTSTTALTALETRERGRQAKVRRAAIAIVPDIAA